MKTFPVVCCLLYSTLAAGASIAAQEGAAPKPAAAAPAAGSPMFALKTGMEEIASQLLRMKGDDSLPTKEDDEHWVFTIDDGGAMQVSTGKGKVDVLSFTASPVKLVKVYAKRMTQFQRTAEMFGGMAAGQSGWDPSVLNEFIGDVFKFPQQVETVSLEVTGSPDTAFNAQLDLTPAAGGWLAEFVAKATPNPKGAPILEDGGALTAAVSMDGESVAKITGTFGRLTASAAADGEAERKQLAAVMSKTAAALDGAMSVVFNPAAGGLRIISGLRDAAAAVALFTSQEVHDMQKAMAEANPQAEIDYEAKGLSHRDVVLAKTKASMSMPSPIAPEGDMTTFSGVAGEYHVTVMTSKDDAEAKKTVDDILDKRVKRKSLGEGVLATVDVKVADVIAAMSQGQADAEEAPRAVSAQASKNGNGLRIKVKVEK
jgi:hypothetical protein